ncbi:hypothetical protein BC830DRAFT_1131872 [Chytriomyces sp. MP71]|nr:hypothetical protein BC830DRAFT_1131872 [Chytriomyces sp. MP71]
MFIVIQTIVILHMLLTTCLLQILQALLVLKYMKSNKSNAMAKNAAIRTSMSNTTPHNWFAEFSVEEFAQLQMTQKG